MDWFPDDSSLTIIINSAKSFKKLSTDCWKWCLQNQLEDLYLIFFLVSIQPFWHTVFNHFDWELLNIKHLMNYKNIVFFLGYLSYHNNFVGRDSSISENYIINMINKFRWHFWRPPNPWGILSFKMSMPQSWHNTSSQSSLMSTRHPIFASYTQGFSLEYFFPCRNFMTGLPFPQFSLTWFSLWAETNSKINARILKNGSTLQSKISL